MSHLTVTVLFRETLLVRDGQDWMTVPCAWGVDPSLAFLPPAADWDQVLPAWLRGRRQEVAQAIEEFGLRVKDEDQTLRRPEVGYGDPPAFGT